MTYSAKVGRKTFRSAPLLLFTRSLGFLPMISLCKMSPLSHVSVSISLLALDTISETSSRTLSLEDDLRLGGGGPKTITYC